MNLSPGQIDERAEKAIARLESCDICPRNCGVNRTEDEPGFCRTGRQAIMASYSPHFGEEPPLVGRRGSGTIFFAGCNLGCIFCQNYDISHQRQGSKRTIEQLVRSMLDLQSSGCSNINFVTPTHVVAAVAAAIELAREKGLTLPTVYNTGGYDSVKTLKLLEGLIDIYMPDMKYSDPDVAGELSNAPDYPKVNFAAVKEMHRQVGDLKTENGLATRGLLVRHLILPGGLAGSFEIIDFLAGKISRKTTINVMAQYHPSYQAFSHPHINHRPSTEEIVSARRYAMTKGLHVLD